METQRLSRISRSVAAFLTPVLILVLTACNPALYKQPAEDFRSASTSLRDVYFLELELSNRAQIERGDLDDQISIWNSPPGSTFDPVSRRMAERRNQDIHAQLRPLRQRAFAALDGYASTLVSLSSDEPTERIQSELSELVKDINGTLESAEKLNLAGKALGKLKKFTGPLEQYVAVLNEIIGIVSNILREQAIVKTIGKSNDSILALLGVLSEEAMAAQHNALTQIRGAKEAINYFSNHDKFLQADNSVKSAAIKRGAELKVIEQQIAAQDIAAAFDSAKKAQGALVEKAMLKDPGDWTSRIRRFREQVAATKMASEKIRSEM